MLFFKKLTLLYISFISILFCQDISWYNYGPYGAFAYDIVEADNGEIFTATEAGIYKKNSIEDKWKFIGGSNGANSICIDDKKNIIVGTFYRGIYYSNDYGNTWIYPTSNLESRLTQIYYLDNESLYLAVNSKGLYFSKNIDSSFVHISDPLLNKRKCFRLYQDRNNYIYVGTDSGIFRTKAIGSGWGHYGLSGKFVYYIIESPDQKLWACTGSNGLYKYNEQEKEWEYKGLGGWSDAYPSYLYFLNSDTIFCGGCRFYKSYDGGNTWIKEDFPYSINCIEKLNKNELLFSNGEWGIYRYNIDSSKIIEDNLGLTNKFLYSIDISSNDQIVLSGRCGVYYSSNHGLSYKLIYPVENGYYPNSNAVFTNDGKTIIYATSYGPIYKYSNNSWKQIFDTGTGSWPIVYKGNNNDLYLTTKYHEIYYSSDLGEYWGLQKNFDDHYLGKISPYKNYIILGTNDGLLKSTDNGRTWENFAFKDTAVYSYYINKNNEIFVPYRYMLFNSDNNGKTWKKIFSKISCGAVGSICTNSEGYIFITTNDGIYVSVDKGITWRLYNDGLETFWGLFLDCDSKDYVYVIMNYHGIFRTMKTTTGFFENINNLIIQNFILYQNYPNPFNPTTTIKYALSKASKIKLEVFNVLGQKVATLVNGRKAAGYHKVTFNGSGLPSGVYYYRLLTDGGFLKTRKFLLVK